MNSWNDPNVGNDWEQQINEYISNLMRPRNQQAEYLQQQAGTSQNPGMYYQQLAAQAEPDPMKLAQQALLGQQAKKMGYEADLAHAQAQVEGRKAEAADPDFGIKYMKGTGGQSELIPYFGPDWSGGHAGGGKGGGIGAPGLPQLTQEERDALKAKALADTRSYNAFDPYAGTYSQPHGLINYSGGGPSYDPSTSSYGPSGGEPDSWADPYNPGGLDMTGW